MDPDFCILCDEGLYCPVHDTIDIMLRNEPVMLMFISCDDDIPIKYMHLPNCLVKSWYHRHRLYPTFMHGTQMLSYTLTSSKFPKLLFFLLYVNDPKHDIPNRRVESSIDDVCVPGDALIIAMDRETGEDVCLPRHRWLWLPRWEFTIH